MIVTEYYRTRTDGVVLNRTYSDAGYYIVRNGVEYTEAIDPADLGRTYTESTRKIEEESSEVPAEQALAELMEAMA